MARINISVPDETREKMKTIAGVNWSAIAKNAFHEKLEILEKRHVSYSQAQIDRLRQSRDKHLQLINADGLFIGKSWALKKAEYRDIMRIISYLDDSNLLSLSKDIDLPEHDINELLTTLAKLILDNKYPTQREVDEVIETIFRIKTPSLDTIKGFYDGVNQIYIEVESLDNKD